MFNSGQSECVLSRWESRELCQGSGCPGFLYFYELWVRAKVVSDWGCLQSSKGFLLPLGRGSLGPSMVLVGTVMAAIPHKVGVKATMWMIYIEAIGYFRAAVYVCSPGFSLAVCILEVVGNFCLFQPLFSPIPCSYVARCLLLWGRQGHGVGSGMCKTQRSVVMTDIHSCSDLGGQSLEGSSESLWQLCGRGANESTGVHLSLVRRQFDWLQPEVIVAKIKKIVVEVVTSGQILNICCRENGKNWWWNGYEVWNEKRPLDDSRALVWIRGVQSYFLEMGRLSHERLWNSTSPVLQILFEIPIRHPSCNIW